MSTQPFNAAQHPRAGDGTFTAATHSDAVPALVVQSQPPRNPEWHEAVADLVEQGSTPEEARCKLVFLLSYKIAEAYSDQGWALLARGNEVDAAMVVIAASSLRDLPRKVHEAEGDQTKALTAVQSARRSLKAGGALLDGLHPSGRQPVFAGADEFLTDFEEFLTPATNGAP
jgi:hypothetical protein